MTFYLLLIGIILLPILIILPALRNKRAIIDSNRDTENINIARQRMREIAKFEQPKSAHFQQAQLELQATLLEDLHTDGKANKPDRTVAFKSWGVLIIVLIPLLSFSMYSYLGSPQFAVPSIGGVGGVESTKQSDKPLEIAQLIALLEEKLTQDPDNAEGWELAATTYMKLGEYKKAMSAYEKLNTLMVGNTDFLVAWADAEILAKGNAYTPAAKTRIEKALAINPQHINGLWIASLGANSLGEYAKSLDHLNTLLSLLASDSQSTDKIKRLMARIRAQTSDLDVANLSDKTQQQVATDNPSTTNSRVIRVEVMLADHLIAQADKNDLVFIFAKALEGPATPLAVSKHHVKDLPIKITLTENMAMLPNMSIASFDEITVTARVSKTDKSIQQAGDLVSDTTLITEQTQNRMVKLIIDQIVR